MRVVPAVTLFLAALWCGALSFFALTAGLVLQASMTRHAGGTVNRALLDALDAGSYAFVVILFLLLLLGDRSEVFTKGTRGALLRLLLVALAATVASHEIVTPQMMDLRSRMGSIIDLVPKSDPLRREWGRLHAFSAIALLVRILAAAVFFGILFRALVPGRQVPGVSPPATQA